MPLHSAFCEARPGKTGALVHPHVSHAVALSTLTGADPEIVLPPLTACGAMRLVKVALLPCFMPGDPAMGNAIRGLAGKRSAVMLAHHGPLVAARDLEAAVYAMKKLEETAKPALLTRGLHPAVPSPAQISGLVQKFDVECDE